MCNEDSHSIVFITVFTYRFVKFKYITFHIFWRYFYTTMKSTVDL